MIKEKKRLENYFSNWKRENISDQAEDDNRRKKKRKTHLIMVHHNKELFGCGNFEEEEIDKYFNQLPPDGTEYNNCLQWWNSHQKEYPNLSLYAKKFLVINGTTSPIERCWSKGNEIASDQRYNLRANTLEKILFLKYNDHLLTSD